MTTLVVRADVLLACCGRTLSLRVPGDAMVLNHVRRVCGLHARYCPEA